MEVREIPLSQISISESNTRKNLRAGTEDSTLDDLARSIRENGLLSPVTVLKTNGRYELVVGQRRLLACKRIGLETIPAIIRDQVSDIDALTLSLIENIHRADMHPIDKARAFKKLYDRYGNYSKVSQESGVSVPAIQRYLRLLDLSPSIQEELTTSEGPAGVGTLSKLASIFASHDEQELALERIGGFTQKVQLEILQRSKGDVHKLETLREQALEGAFDTHICHGIHECQFIPDVIKKPINQIIQRSKSDMEFVDSLKDFVS